MWVLEDRFPAGAALGGGRGDLQRRGARATSSSSCACSTRPTRCSPTSACSPARGRSPTRSRCRRSAPPPSTSSTRAAADARRAAGASTCRATSRSSSARFANAALEHRTCQVASDGSLKLPARISAAGRCTTSPPAACRAGSRWSSPPASAAWRRRTPTTPPRSARSPTRARAALRGARPPRARARARSSSAVFELGIFAPALAQASGVRRGRRRAARACSSRHGHRGRDRGRDRDERAADDPPAHPAAAGASRRAASRPSSTPRSRALPIVSPHGHVEAALLARRRAVRRSGGAARHARPLRHAPAARPRRRAGRAAPAGRPALDLAAAVRALAAAGRDRRAAVARARPARRARRPHRAVGRHRRRAVRRAVRSASRGPELRPRALYERFGIELLATTDDPADDLRHHRALAADPRLDGPRRPDVPARRAARPRAARTGRRRSSASRRRRTCAIGGYDDFVAALEQRRRYFAAHGATSTRPRRRAPGDRAPRRRAPRAAIFAAALRGDCAARGRRGVRARTCSTRWRACPARTASSCSCTRASCATTTARRCAPTAPTPAPTSRCGPSSPPRCDRCSGATARTRAFGSCCSPSTRRRSRASSRRSRASIRRSTSARRGGFWTRPPGCCASARPSPTRSAFTAPPGFVDDARALCSIPARHEVARRVDCSFLAGLVCEHRLSLDEAAAIARDLAHDQACRVFARGGRASD